MITISRKSAPNASAVLLRRRRRPASRYGPMPGGACSSPASAPRSVLNSVPVDSVVAMDVSRRVGPRPAPASAPGGTGDSVALDLQGREVGPDQRVEDRCVHVDAVGVELRRLLLPVH